MVLVFSVSRCLSGCCWRLSGWWVVGRSRNSRFGQAMVLAFSQNCVTVTWYQPQEAIASAWFSHGHQISPLAWEMAVVPRPTHSPIADFERGVPVTDDCPGNQGDRPIKGENKTPKTSMVDYIYYLSFQPLLL